MSLESRRATRRARARERAAAWDRLTPEARAAALEHAERAAAEEAALTPQRTRTTLTRHQKIGGLTPVAASKSCSSTGRPRCIPYRGAL